MAELFTTYRGVVYPWQCDHMGHLNIMGYSGKFDEATWQMFAAIGVTPGWMKAEGCAVVATHQETAFRREVQPGAVISVRTGILEMRSLRIRFYHEMVNDETGEVAAATVITGVLIDSATRKPCPFPAAVLEQGRQRLVAVQPRV